MSAAMPNGFAFPVTMSSGKLVRPRPSGGGTTNTAWTMSSGARTRSGVASTTASSSCDLGGDALEQVVTDLVGHDGMTEAAQHAGGLEAGGRGRTVAPGGRGLVDRLLRRVVGRVVDGGQLRLTSAQATSLSTSTSRGRPRIRSAI